MKELYNLNCGQIVTIFGKQSLGKVIKFKAFRVATA